MKDKSNPERNKGQTPPYASVRMFHALLSEGKREQAWQLAQKASTNTFDGDEIALLAAIGTQWNQVDWALALQQERLKLESDKSKVYLSIGVLHFQQENLLAALENLNSAHSLNPKSKEIQFALGAVYLKLNRIDPAINCFQNFLKQDNQAKKARLYLGICFSQKGYLAEALTEFKKMTNQDGSLYHDSLIYRVRCHIGLSQLDAAERLLENEAFFKVKTPDIIRLHLSLCQVRKNVEAYEQWYKRPELQQVLTAQDQLDYGNLIAGKRPEEAFYLMEAVLSTKQEANLTGRVHSSLGKILDRKGDHQKAFIHFQQSKELEERNYKENESGRFMEMVRRLKTFYADGNEMRDLKPVVNRSTNQPVFIVGFPRSGTTLVDQIIHSHSRFHVVEEREILSKARDELRQMGGYPYALSQVNAKQLGHVRTAYERELKRFLPHTRKNIRPVDKYPLNMIHIGLIHQLYPKAPIILVQRHPLDSLLSSFMQFYDYSAAMACLTRIESAALFYRELFELVAIYREKLNLNLHVVTYEKLVGNFDHEVSRLFDFLGEPMEESVKSFHIHARNRNIRTPSAHQVSEKIYSKAVNRWVRYKEQLAPVFPLIGETCDKLGYELEISS